MEIIPHLFVLGHLNVASEKKMSAARTKAHLINGPPLFVGIMGLEKHELATFSQGQGIHWFFGKETPKPQGRKILLGLAARPGCSFDYALFFAAGALNCCVSLFDS